MLYTIGEMAKILNVAPSTLRYYDKEGLLPFVERSGAASECSRIRILVGCILLIV